MVAIIKQLIKNIKPTIKIGTLTILAMSCPSTKTAKTNLPISYSAFASNILAPKSNSYQTPQILT